jgi:hypothetical protein
MPEAPHDADGFYTCECGKDRHSKPYNRRSVMHVHELGYAITEGEPLFDVRAQLRTMVDYIKRQYGIRRWGDGEAGWYCHGGHVAGRKQP